MFLGRGWLRHRTSLAVIDNPSPLSFASRPLASASRRLRKAPLPEDSLPSAEMCQLLSRVAEQGDVVLEVAANLGHHPQSPSASRFTVG